MLPAEKWEGPLGTIKMFHVERSDSFPELQS